MTKTKATGPDPEEHEVPVEEPPEESPAPLNEDGSLAWHPTFRSMLDHPKHPLHHLRNA